MNRSLTIQTPQGPLHGHLDIHDTPRGLVLLARAHHAPVDTVITANLAARGYAIFFMELLSARETQFADASQNVPKLTQRLLDMLDLIRSHGEMQDLPLAIFASGDATPAALRAAAQRDLQVKVIAGHGGVIDRAGLQALNLLSAPLMMLYDSDDEIGRNAYLRAEPHLRCVHEMHTINPADDPVTHLAAWFSLHPGN